MLNLDSNFIKLPFFLCRASNSVSNDVKTRSVMLALLSFHLTSPLSNFRYVPIVLFAVMSFSIFLTCATLILLKERPFVVLRYALSNWRKNVGRRSVEVVACGEVLDMCETPSSSMGFNPL